MIPAGTPPTAALTNATLRWSGGELDLSEPRIMGVLNVTPDSFSDGGLFHRPEDAIAHGLQMVEQGAEILDVGGESSRPAGAVYGAGAERVSEAEEIGRVVPVIRALSLESGVPISIDTTKSAVAEAALEAGAVMVNDISGLSMDPRMGAVCAAAECPVVLMHMRGNPGDTFASAAFDDVVADVVRELAEAVDRAVAAGIARDQLVLDPGLGFGKPQAGNLQMIRDMAAFHTLGLPLLMGPSRKAFIGEALGGVGVEGRDWGTAAAVAVCVWAGAHIVRVHDVSPMRDVVRVTRAIARGTFA
jgi:dihydropteroate synthase